MKTSDEMVSSLLERRDAYVTRQNQKRRTVMRFASVTCAVALVALLGVGVAHSGWLTPVTPSVDDPAVTAPITKPTEEGSRPTGGDDGSCTVHSLRYHSIPSNFRDYDIEAWIESIEEDEEEGKYNESSNIVNFVEYFNIPRERFIELMKWDAEKMDELMDDAEGNRYCPYTYNQFLDAIYDDNAELTAWVFAPCSTWPMASEWDLLGEEGLVPEEWPPEGYGFGETLPEMEETEE